MSGDPSIFIQDYLVQQYCINPGELINVRRLPSCPNSTPNQCPPPVIFTVSNFKVKKKILQKLFELRADIQFRSNQSREDHLKHRELVLQLKERTASSEKKSCNQELRNHHKKQRRPAADCSSTAGDDFGLSCNVSHLDRLLSPDESVNSSFVSVDDDVSCINELSSSSSHFFSANSTVSSGASSTEPLSAGVFFANKSSLHSATKSATRHANDIGKLRILSANTDGLFNKVPELHLRLAK